MISEKTEEIKANLGFTAAVIVSSITMLFVFFVAPALVKTPDVNMDLFLAVRYFGVGDILPEPVEQVRYVLALLVPSILFFLFFYFDFNAILVSKFRDTIAFRAVNRFGALSRTSFGISLTILVLYCLFIQVKDIHAYYKNLHFYIAVLIIFSIYWHISIANHSRYPLFSHTSSWIPTAIVLFLACGAGTLSYYPGWSEPAISYNMLFTLNEFAAVVNGRMPGVDFIPQYSNLLPVIFSPILRLAGVTSTSFSLLMSLLNVVCIICFYEILSKATHDRWKALLCFLPVLGAYLFPIAELSDGIRYFGGNYYGVFPLRYVLPLILLVFFSYYVRTQRISLVAPMFGFGVLTAFNNLDFGVPAFGALAVSWTLLQISETMSTGRIAWRSVLCCLAGTAAGIIVYLGTTFIYSGGGIVDFNILTMFQRVFAKEGFYMLPMPGFIGLHLVIYATYMGALALGLFDILVSKRGQVQTATAPLMVFMAIFGLGIGFYYVGRTHWHTLAVMFPFWTLTLATTYLHLMQVTNTSGETEKQSTSFMLTQSVILSFLLLFFFGLKDFPDLRHEISRLQHQEPRIIQSSDLIDRLAKILPKGSTVALLYDEPHRLANDLEVNNVFPFGSPRVVLKEQLDFALQRFEANGLKQFYSDEQFNGFFGEFFVARGWRGQLLSENIVMYSKI